MRTQQPRRDAAGHAPDTPPGKRGCGQASVDWLQVEVGVVWRTQSPGPPLDPVPPDEVVPAWSSEKCIISAEIDPVPGTASATAVQDPPVSDV